MHSFSPAQPATLKTLKEFYLCYLHLPPPAYFSTGVNPHLVKPQQTYDRYYKLQQTHLNYLPSKFTIPTSVQISFRHSQPLISSSSPPPLQSFKDPNPSKKGACAIHHSSLPGSSLRLERIFRTRAGVDPTSFLLRFHARDQ